MFGKKMRIFCGTAKTLWPYGRITPKNRESRPAIDYDKGAAGLSSWLCRLLRLWPGKHSPFGKQMRKKACLVVIKDCLTSFGNEKDTGKSNGPENMAKSRGVEKK